ncbi:MAG: c-type cytochrome [Alphaproteobacteria bacterium]
MALRHIISRLWTSGISLIVAIAFAGSAMIMIPATVSADENLQASIARGGLLYDKWWKVIGADEPKKGNAAYPADKKYAGKSSSYRCKECHGWDYRGKDGAYASGKHFSGIKGVNGMKGASNAAIIKVLKDKTHALDEFDDDDFQDAANFVSKGQLDTAKYIDGSKNPINANIKRGADIYGTTCARCHASDGTKPKDMGKSLAMQMGNPWEVMHKVMNGHPGQNMPSFRVFGPQVAVDVMAYVQTLPSKKLK